LAPDARAQFTISGTVTDPEAVPVDSVRILLYDDEGDPIGVPPTRTNSSGFYSISGIPPDTYGVGFEPLTATGLLDKIVAPVEVSANVTLNTSLVRGGILSGFVRDSLGVGIPNIDLNVYDQLPDTVIFTPGDNTDVTGFYDVVIPVGIYRLRWRAVGGENLVPVEYRDVTITSDTTIDVTMKPGFFVSGTVLDQSMTPVFNADFDFIISSTGQKIVTSNDNTDNSGLFNILVAVGTYDIQVEPIITDKLVPQEIVGITITKDTTMNFTLAPGFLVSGFITDSNAVPVFNADLDLKYTGTRVQLFTPGDNTDTLGLFQIIAPSGQYDIIVKPPVASRLAPIRIDSNTISADIVVNAVVPEGVILSGIVQNSSAIGVWPVDIDAKDPITGAKIPLSGDHTDDTGFFNIVIVSGSYDLEIEPDKILRLSAVKIFGFTITADTSIFVQVDTGLAVSGTVRDSLGVIVPDVKTKAIESISGDTVFTPANSTDSLGQYLIILPPETYNLLYIPDTLSGIADSALLNNVVVANDTIIDVTLAGDFKAPPVLALIGNQATFVNIALFIPLSATDPNGTIPTIGAINLPSGAIVVDNLDGTGSFDWTPNLADTGVHLVTFFTSDGSLADSEQINITVVDSSGGGVNAPPVLASIGHQVAYINIELFIPLSASDPNGTIPTIGAVNLPSGAIVVDLNNGTGFFDWTPSLADTGIHPVTFFTSDGSLADSEKVNFIVVDSANCCVGNAGDVNLDGTDANILDLTYLIDRIFRGGAPAACPKEADLNGDGTPANILDLTFLVDRIFRGGSASGPCLP